MSEWESDSSFEIEKDYQQEITKLNSEIKRLSELVTARHQELTEAKSELDKTTFCLEQEQKMREDDQRKIINLMEVLQLYADFPEKINGEFVGLYEPSLDGFENTPMGTRARLILEKYKKENK